MWGALGYQDLTYSEIYYKPLINSRNVQEERTGDGAQRSGYASDSGADINIEEAQEVGSYGCNRKRADEIVMSPGKVRLSEYLWDDVIAPIFWKRETSVMFGI